MMTMMMMMIMMMYFVSDIKKLFEITSVLNFLFFSLVVVESTNLRFAA